MNEKNKNENGEKMLKELFDYIFGANNYKAFVNGKTACNNKNCDCEKTKTAKDLYKDYADNIAYKGLEMSNILDDDQNNIGVKLMYAIPGVDKKDLSVALEENTCIVSSKEKVFYFGKLESKVRMKFDIDYDKTVTKFENGVLSISLFKKKNESKQFKLNIQ